MQPARGDSATVRRSKRNEEILYSRALAYSYTVQSKLIPINYMSQEETIHSSPAAPSEEI